MTTSAISKAVHAKTLEDPEIIRRVVAAVADIVAGKVIADGQATVPGLGCFSVIYSGGKPYGVGFMACSKLNDAVKAKGEHHAG